MRRGPFAFPQALAVALVGKEGSEEKAERPKLSIRFYKAPVQREQKMSYYVNEADDRETNREVIAAMQCTQNR